MHSVRPLGVFIGLLQDAGVRLVVDVRAISRSRANPQYNGNTLPSSLSEFHIGSEHIAELGSADDSRMCRWPRMRSGGGIRAADRFSSSSGNSRLGRSNSHRRSNKNQEPHS